MADELDSIVKGAPLPAETKPLEETAAGTGTSGVDTSGNGKSHADPLSHAPSSPSMIYLNLLVLEASLRAQYLELRARRRHHTFFLTLLAGWLLFFLYFLFLAPREDGRGIGGSIYWMVEGAEKICMISGALTAVLVWVTGIFDRGIRWPRKWLAVTNRGLRGVNCKLVVIRRPWYAEMLSTTSFYLTYGLFHRTASSSYRPVPASILIDAERELQQTSSESHHHQQQQHQHQQPLLPIVLEDEERGHATEEDLAPGGDYVKLLLLAKPFSATFRENWELYRAEYWERENERRAVLRTKLKAHDRQLAKQQPLLARLFPFFARSSASDHFSEKIQHHGHVSHGHSHSQHHGQSAAVSHPRHLAVHNQERHGRRRSSSVRRGSSSSSRSQTPTLDDAEPPVSRKASTASTASDKRRKKATTSSPSSASTSSPAVSSVKRPTESRSVTPDFPSPLAMSESPPKSSASKAGGTSSRPR